MTQPQIQTVKRYTVKITHDAAGVVIWRDEEEKDGRFVLASDYAALEQRVEKLERDWKEKCIEAGTMRQHHKNAEASLREAQKQLDCVNRFTPELVTNCKALEQARESLREQEERTNRVIHLLKEDWISNYAFRHNQIVQGKWEDAIIEAQARWFESPTRAALRALRERVEPVAYTCESCGKKITLALLDQDYRCEECRERVAPTPPPS